MNNDIANTTPTIRPSRRHTKRHGFEQQQNIHKRYAFNNRRLERN